MTIDHGFVFCASLDGRGAASEIMDNQGRVWLESSETVWFHLDFSDIAAREWLDTTSGLSELTVEMLVSEDTRPRVSIADGGLLICLRAVNCNPGSDADDMVSLRLWITGNRILSMRRRRVEAVSDIRAGAFDTS